MTAKGTARWINVYLFIVGTFLKDEMHKIIHAEHTILHSVLRTSSHETKVTEIWKKKVINHLVVFFKLNNFYMGE